MGDVNIAYIASGALLRDSLQDFSPYVGQAGMSKPYKVEIVDALGGARMVASSASGRLYTSANGGTTWTERQPAGALDKDWRALAADSDCTQLIAGVYNGRLYTSADSGGTWTERQPAGAANKNWQAIAANADGTILLAGVYLARVYKSVNSGVDWAEVRPAGDANKNWYTAAMSRTGRVMLLGEASTGDLYVSTDYGVTWTKRQPSGAVEDWRGVSMSYYGKNMLAVAVAGRVYTSTDYGVSWTERQPAGNADKDWTTCASSSDGKYLIAGIANGRIYMSANYGVSWAEIKPAGDVNEYWYSSAIDFDGSVMLVGCHNNGRLWLSTNYGASWAEVRPAGDTDKSWRACDVATGNPVIGYIGEEGTGETLSTECVVNGDMEIDDDWVTDGNVSVQGQTSAQVHSGTYSWYFTTTAANWGGIKNGTDYATTVTAGEMLKFSFWIYPVDQTFIYVHVANGGDVGLGDYIIDGVKVTGLTTGTWNYVELYCTATTTGDGSVLNIRFRTGIGGADQVAGTWYIDDVSLKAVTETAANIGVNIYNSKDSSTQSWAGITSGLQPNTALTYHVWGATSTTSSSTSSTQSTTSSSSSSTSTTTLSTTSTTHTSGG